MVQAYMSIIMIYGMFEQIIWPKKKSRYAKVVSLYQLSVGK
jgi:hypothetical protein